MIIFFPAVTTELDSAVVFIDLKPQHRVLWSLRIRPFCLWIGLTRRVMDEFKSIFLNPWEQANRSEQMWSLFSDHPDPTFYLNTGASTVSGWGSVLRYFCFYSPHIQQSIHTVKCSSWWEKTNEVQGYSTTFKGLHVKTGTYWVWEATTLGTVQCAVFRVNRATDCWDVSTMRCHGMSGYFIKTCCLKKTLFFFFLLMFYWRLHFFLMA